MKKNWTRNENKKNLAKFYHVYFKTFYIYWIWQIKSKTNTMSMSVKLYKSFAVKCKVKARNTLHLIDINVILMSWCTSSWWDLSSEVTFRPFWVSLFSHWENPCTEQIKMTKTLRITKCFCFWVKLLFFSSYVDMLKLCWWWWWCCTSC